MKKKYTRKYKRIDTFCLVFIGILFFTFVLINVIGPEHKTFSEREKRELAKFPSFSFGALFDGTFTSGITDYFNDHFFLRDPMIDLSRRIGLLYGVDYSLGDSSLVILDGGNRNTDRDKQEELDRLIEEREQNKHTAAPTETAEPAADPSTVKLSKTEMKLTVGAGTMISVTGVDEADVRWSVDSSGVVSLVRENGLKADVKAEKEGEGTLTCSAGSLTLTCKFTVEPLDVKDGGDIPDVGSNGLFIYDGAVYSSGFFSLPNFTQYADVAGYYKNTFSPDRLTVVIGPVSGIMVDNDNLREILLDQPAAFADMKEVCDARGINFPDTASEILGHRDEYLYYKTDHHWTDLGAYYAYVALAESLGFTPTPLESFRKAILSETYQGSMFDYSGDERVKSFFDTVEAYIPTKPLTMTCYTKQGEVQTYDSAVMEWSQTYSAFLCGDNPYTVINVPSNPQDLNALVLKDSFGNALVPYLAEHYGNIFIVDARYSNFSVSEKFADYHFNDVIFINNIEAASSPAWPTLYLKALG